MSADDIIRLKVTLDDVEPPVLRRIEVPLTIRLDRLHSALQAAIGWTDSHLYEIRARDVRWGVPDPDWGGGPLDARKARLVDVLEETGAKTLKYLYDFGDGWEHTIEVERVAEAVRGRFLYSGGIGSLDDLRALARLRQVNLAGVIVGKALYERRFTIAEGQAALDGG
jgi:hypothetical protein